MFNGVVIHSSRKGLVYEVIAAIKAENIPADIRLIGPGISQMSALFEQATKLWWDPIHGLAGR